VTRHLVLSGGPAHDFAATSDELARSFAACGVATTIVDEPTAALALLRAVEAGEADPFDVVTVNALRWRMDAERYAHLREAQAFDLTAEDAGVFDRFVRRGGGLLALHAAVICFDAEPIWHALCGASWNWESSSHPPVGDAFVEVTGAGRVHPLTAGLDDFTLTDEVYGFLDEEPGLDALLVSEHGGRSHPLLWAREVGEGRVVTDLLGHGPSSLQHPVHREILSRAVRWLSERRT